MGRDTFDVVDGEDNAVGRASRGECHTKGLIHRSVMFFIFDKKGRVFVNQRSKSKDILPGKWSIVLGGHLDAGESYDEAVEREFHEETGLHAKPFRIGFFRKYIPEEREHVTVYGFAVDDYPSLDPDETMYGEFMDVQDLEKIIEERDFLPETPTLHRMLLKHLENKKKP